MADPSIIIIGAGRGGPHGFVGTPGKKMSVFGRGWETTLPGLSDFYVAGRWASSAGPLFSNALSGRTASKAICKQEGKKLVTG
jgi:hypothetical protein